MLNTKQLIYATIFCSAGILTAALSCKKPVPAPLAFNISGHKNVTLSENGSETIELSVSYISGTNEQLTLSVSGLPEGVSANFSTKTSQPDFKSSLYIKDDSSKGGNYTITLKGRSARGVEKEYDFQLTTFDKLCAEDAAGIYTGGTICRDNENDSFTVFSFIKDSIYRDRLHFTWNNDSAYLIVNCNRNQLTIPYQDVGKFKIEGTGYMDLNYSIIHFDYMEKHDNGDTVSCSAHFVKK